ncbi:MAG: hypothetical protein ACI9EF_002158 [Pseudohongiellaceae bacterium]|jgi:hypothetical protein
MRTLLIVLAWSLALGCRDSLPRTAPLSVALERSVLPLNGAYRVVVSGGDLDPLSVTASSVRVEDGLGQPLEHLTSVEDNTIDVFLVIDAELWESPPREVHVLVAGGPSLHGLRDRRGLALGAAATLTYAVEPTLTASQPPRLVAVAGDSLPLDHEVSFSGRLQLTFNGAIDPNTLVGNSCPLGRRRLGLTVSPVIPVCSWRLVGDRFELTLDVGAEQGALRLSTRELGLRGVQGDPPAPQVQLDLFAR